MATAGQIESLLGNPPSSALPKLPVVCTVRVGLPLSLLCRERQTRSSTSGKC